MRILKTILRKLYHLIAFLGLMILFVPQAKATTIQGWANNVDQYTDVNVCPCTAGSCGNCLTVSSISTTDVVQAEAYGYGYTPSTTVYSNYGDMILSYHRYKSGYLYSHTSYICSNTSFNMGNVDLYAGSYSDTMNKVGNLTYHNFLVQTLSNNPFNNNTTFGKCYGFTDLFVTYVDGQNLGKVFIPSNTFTGNIYLIGESYEELGLYTETVRNVLSSVISSSGLATANSVNQVNSSVNQVKQEISSINDTMNDSSIDSSDSTINNLKTQVPTNSVISDLLLLPVRFLQNFVNALGSSCTQFSLGSLYGTNLFMPCINLQNYLGSGIWTTIDLIFSGLFVYSLRKKFIEIYQNLTNLKNGGNEVD